MISLSTVVFYLLHPEMEVVIGGLGALVGMWNYYMLSWLMDRTPQVEKE